MQSTFANRIVDFIGDGDDVGPTDRSSTADTAPRSPAQRDAARKNGAKSRGPKTQQGKSRSRLNAMKHGILARVVCPPADGRGDDRLYRQIRKRLIAELKPKGFLDHAAVDGLAADFVNLARARRIAEELQRPPATVTTPATMSDAERWAKIAETRGVAKLLLRLQRHTGRAPFTLTPGQAARVAARLASFVAGVRSDWADFQADAEAEEDDDDHGGNRADALPASPGPAAGTTAVPVSAGEAAFEAEENRLLAEQAALVGDAGDRLCDRAYVAGVLSGRTKARRGDPARLRSLSRHAAGAARQWLNGQRDFIKRADRVQAEALRRQAGAPERLMLLSRYQRSIERAIDEKLRRFNAA